MKSSLSPKHNLFDFIPLSISPIHRKFNKTFDPSKLRLLQSFGDRREICSPEDEDYITTLSFDRTGDYLSVGDRSGRLVFFKYVSNNLLENFEEDSVILEKSHNLKYKRISSKDFSSKGSFNPVEFEYLFDFQSHLQEFDYMKSEEIDQKINFIKWMHNNGPQLNVISANSKTIKLWKISSKISKKASLVLNSIRGVTKTSSKVWMDASYKNNFMESSIRNNIDTSVKGMEKSSIGSESEQLFKPSLKQEFFKLHKYAINSISLTQNDEFMLTSDDLKIYLWSLTNPNTPYNIINKTPFDMVDLSEVITCSSLSKKNDNLFLFGTSTGAINLGDMRIAGVCDRKCTQFKSKKIKNKETAFFTDILASISSCEFNPDENHIIGRDYLNLKIWDVRNTKEPLLTIPLQNEIKNHLCKLYENDGIFDKFKVSVNKNWEMAVSGMYNDSFHVLNLKTAENHQINILNNDEINVQKLLIGEDATGNGNDNVKNPKINFNNKILQCEFHPKKNCFALACLNCLYIFGA